MANELFSGNIDQNVFAQRLHSAISHNIGVEIVSGKRKPGELFGGELEASEALGVSRTAYREAIRILVAKGLIESRPKAGTRVLPRSQWNILDPDVLAWMFEGDPDPDFIIDLFELRSIIEPVAASFAAISRNDEEIEVMKTALDDMAHFGLSDERGRSADQKFHRTILIAARNEALASLSSSVGAAIRWTTIFKHKKLSPPRDSLPDHKQVLDAIIEKDPNLARDAMMNLLQIALEELGIPHRKIRTINNNVIG